jgi:hypothetical protein
MRKLFCLLALLAFPAWADLVAKDGENEVRLMMTPCRSAAILATIKPEHRDEFQAGQATFEGRGYTFCWGDTKEGAYWLAFDNGKHAVISVTSFINSPGI